MKPLRGGRRDQAVYKCIRSVFRGHPPHVSRYELTNGQSRLTHDYVAPFIVGAFFNPT